jgi:hypothetical protein
MVVSFVSGLRAFGMVKAYDLQYQEAMREIGERINFS